MAHDVYLDTSFLRGVGTHTLAGMALMRLVKEHGVVLYVHTLVERELTTGISKRDKTSYAEALQKVQSWLQDLRVIRCDIEPADAQEVFDLYFDGRPPFKAPKNRNDLPDGFIFVRLRSLAASRRNSGSLHALIGDHALRGACDALRNLQAHEDLRGLATEVFPYIAAGALRDVCKENYGELIEEINEQVYKSLRSGSEIDLKDGGTMTVKSPGVIDRLTYANFDWADSDPIDTDLISIPFYARLGRSAVLVVPNEKGQCAKTATLDSNEVPAGIDVEGWVDARVKWIGQGILEAIDVRIVEIRPSWDE